MTILVAGATGTTGSAVLRALRDAGAGVRAMTRRPEAAERLRGDGVEAVVADLADPASLAGALDGAAAVFVATDSSPDLPAHEVRLARAATDAGVGHLVKLSVISAAADSPLAFGRLHQEAEEAIRATGIGWTMVRPNGFMQNTLAWATQIPSGTVAVPVADARWSIVDVRDIAAVAAAALLDPAAHAGRAHVVTGPAASSPREQVAILAEVLGRDLEVVDLPIERFEEQLLGWGVPAWTAERLSDLNRFYVAGHAEAVHPDVEEVTGRPARDFREFAADHRSAFAGT